MQTQFSTLTDDELLRLVGGKEQRTPLEIELALRVERLQDEVAQLTSEPKPVWQ